MRRFAILLLALTVAACSPAGTPAATPTSAPPALTPAQPPSPEPTDASPPTQPPSPTETSASLPTASAPEYTPCTGYSSPDPGASFIGPWAMRLILAYSDDGLTFTRANRVLADASDVPDAITMPDGAVLVYYMTLCDNARDTLIVAASRDHGETWTYKQAVLVGKDALGLGKPNGDPSVEFTPDGRLRLYFTSNIPGPGSKATTYSAVSDDGYTFTVENGARFSLDSAVLDPNVLLVGSTWHYFAGGLPEANYHATSSDGLSFAQADNFVYENILMANGLAVDGGYRYYGFVQSQGAGRIRSLFTGDGQTWAVEPGNRLELDASSGLESVMVKDPGVTRLNDGRYLMVYVTVIPGYPAPDPRTQPPPPAQKP